MRTIALVAINARYSHASLGLHYLRANLGALREQARILEFSLQESPTTMADKIRQSLPALIAIGVYIWNRTQVEELVRIIRTADPAIPIVLGGPEITYDTDSPLAAAATCVVCGEADLAFRDVCGKLLAGQQPPAILHAPPPALSDILLPYTEYTDHDIATRVLYVETTRGCAYACEYCISAIQPGIRLFPLNRVLPEFERLLARGARRFKFVDRSFNLPTDHACAILDFFIQHWQPGMRLHLEMTPDHLPPALRQRLLQFPDGGLHIEVGIQTFTESVARRVGRTTRMDAAEEGIRFLIEQAHADVHADLIAGLPGETPETFQAGLDRLIALHPTELQVGILKRLHGTPITRHATEWALQFRETPPYDVLATRTMNETNMRDIRRFGMHWDRVINRNWFPRTIPLLWEQQASAFHAFDRFSRELEQQLGLAGFSMPDAARVLYEHLTAIRALPAARVRAQLRADYLADGRRIGIPRFLRDTEP